MNSKVQKIYPLSYMQEGMLFHSLLDKNSKAYFEQISLSIEGEFDVLLAEESLNTLINRHEVLRTFFVYDKIRLPMQGVLRERNTKIYYKDISDLTEKEKGELIEKFLVEDREKGFDLTKDILTRVSVFKKDQHSYQFIWSFHHIIIDGWCMGTILKEFLQVYWFLKNGKEVVLPKVQPYSTYIEWLKSQNKGEQEAYWKSFLEGYDTSIVIPGMLNKQEKEEYWQQEISFRFGRTMTNELVKLANKVGVTLNTVIQSLWGLLLQKYNNTNDIVFGHVVSGRTPEIEGIENMIGLFINTIPVRIKATGETTFEQLVSKTYKSTLESKKYECCSLADIQANSTLKGDLINHIMTFENYPLDEETKKEKENNDMGFVIPNMKSFEQTNYNLNVLVFPGDNVEVKFVYNKNYYDEANINLMGKHLMNIATQVLENPTRLLKEISVLSGDEVSELIFKVNNTNTQYPENKSITQLFEEQVMLAPNKIAAIWGDKEITYRELNEKSNQLALRLQKSGVTKGSVVAIMVERSFELLIGILATLKTGAAYLPVDLSYPEERIKYILMDSNAGTLLVNGKMDELSDFDGEVIDLTDKENYIDGQFVRKDSSPEDLVYIIYTSGSTGKPKGVMIEQKGLVNYIVWARNMYLNEREEEVFALHSSISFDLTVTSIFTPLISGNKIVIYNDTEKELSLFSILKENKCTIVKLTPTHLSMIGHMDNGNSSIRKFIVGGEDLKVSLAKRVYESFKGKIEIFNEYGPTETVVGCMIYKYDYGYDKRTSVPIGIPAANTRIYLLDNQLKPVPKGVAGEIYISGVGVARGYINREELTVEKFVENPFIKGNKMYRTGDLARLLNDGNMEFLGRIDHQVKIRGFRIELGEIESQLTKLPFVKEGVVVVKDEKKGGEKCLVAYVVADRKVSIVEIREHLSKQIPDYMVPSCVVQLDRIPVTANGKVDVRSLPEPDYNKNSKEDFEAPVNETETKLVEIWQDILGIDNIGTKDNFFELGGHSLKATMLAAKINKEFNKEIPLKEIFSNPTINKQASYITSALNGEVLQIHPLERRDYYDLSKAQQRLWTAVMMGEDKGVMNIPLALILENLDVEVFGKSLIELLKRHEILRTNFKSVEGEPKQFINEYDEKLYFINHIDIREHQNRDSALKSMVSEEVGKPFDLEKESLVRVTLIHFSDNRYLFVLTMHHIISDAWSNEVLVKDLISIYKALKQGRENVLQPLRIQYKDFANWQNQFIDSTKAEYMKDFWKNVLSKPLPLLKLKSDFPRPEVKTLKGDHADIVFNSDIIKKLNSLSKDNEASLFMSLMASFYTLLFHYTGQEDIIIGTPIAGREHWELENQVGFYLNVLPLRLKFSAKDSFIDILKKVRNMTLGAYENQSYPFDKIIENASIERDFSRSPLFDVMLQLIDVSKLDNLNDMGGIKVQQYHIDSVQSKYDIVVNFNQNVNSLSAIFEYNTDLFKKETILRMIERYKRLINSIVENPAVSIHDYKLDETTNLFMLPKLKMREKI